MIFMVYVAAGIIAAVASLYFAWRSRDFRKFLAGAFFVNAGILFYLYLADVSVPILGTTIVATPESSGYRSAIHFVLFLLCLYFGFIKAPATGTRG
jgi:hypothetical protein